MADATPAPNAAFHLHVVPADPATGFANTLFVRLTLGGDAPVEQAVLPADTFVDFAYPAGKPAGTYPVRLVGVNSAGEEGPAALGLLTVISASAGIPAALTFAIILQ